MMITLTIADNLQTFNTLSECRDYIDILEQLAIESNTDNPIVREGTISESLQFLRKRAHENHKKKVLHQRFW